VYVPGVKAPVLFKETVAFPVAVNELGEIVTFVPPGAPET
jgi:hypothetical protein